MPPVISVENISKQYRLGEVGTGALSHDLNRWWHKVRGKEDPYLKIGEKNDRSVKGGSDYTWALRDVSFKVNQGEVLGIIGKNGAGKSTLLKILSRVTTPTTGQIKVKGRIASLLEVGTGFHPELTGRENIFLNGAILGMRKHEIAAKFDEIVEFSGCERYIDTPVKRYSSGMYVRLAFAVAAHLEPEILIVDEVLAVGDAEFQKKCLGKMKDVAGQGRTVLFVSHNMAAVENLCKESLVLANGAVEFSGNVHGGVQRYLNQIASISDEVDLDNKPRPKDARCPNAIFAAGLEGANHSPITTLQMGDVARIFFQFKAPFPVNNPSVGFGIHDSHGKRLTSLNNYFLSQHYDPSSEGRAVWTIDNFPFLPGRYSVTVSVYESNRDCIDYVEHAFSFTVVESDYFGSGRILDSAQGIVVVPGTIEFQNQTNTL